MSEKPNGEAVESTYIRVTNHNGYVMLMFNEPRDWCALDPQTAGVIGEAMAREAMLIHTGKEYPDNRSVLSDAKLNLLERRALHMLTSLLRQDKKHLTIARELVKMVLKEVV